MPADPIDLYLDLLKRALMNTIYQDPSILAHAPGPYEEALRADGKDWPRDAHTMIGRKRLDNLEFCCRTAIADNVPGDFLEAGVWRGGASIFMRGVLRAHDVTDRRVWVADSFEGLPPPTPGDYPADDGDVLHTFDQLRVTLEQVQENFRRYGLLDDQVRFLKGWFRDTLPKAPVERVAVLRLDGDMYESTWQTLDALYHRVSPGGFAIVDDYNCLPACKAAVMDFRSANGIDDEIIDIDWTGVFWRKRRPDIS